MVTEKKNLFTLEKLRDDIDKKFSPVVVGLTDGEDVSLRSLLRLGDKDRKLVLDNLRLLEQTYKASKDTEEDEAEGLKRFETLTKAAETVLYTVAQKGKGKKLVADIDGDVPLLLEILTAWTEASQPGEAQPSPSS